MLQGFPQLGLTIEEMGNDLGLKHVPTGAVIRMDLNKVSLKFFHKGISHEHFVFIGFKNGIFFFFKRIRTSMLIKVWSYLILKASNGSVVTISVQFALIYNNTNSM